ncbi:MAG TPA: PEP-CTERM sorting domain-containing protein [Acidobacteriaceae bacterium]|nr:PEP-CTERM sorting domain-containing protein [Acidobacteriaceae bacterium]
MVPRICQADSYEVVALGSDQGVFLYGMTDSGAVVLDNSLYCETACFTTYADGATSESIAPPSLVFDDGTGCSPSVAAGFTVENAVCNGAREASTGYSGTEELATGVYAGGDLLADLVAPGGGGAMMLNALGDIAWDDHFSEEFYEAVDITHVTQAALDAEASETPEPGGWVLMGTGALVVLWMARRRRLNSR